LNSHFCFIFGSSTVISAKPSVLQGTASSICGKSSIIFTKSSIIRGTASLIPAKSSVIQGRASSICGKSSIIFTMASVIRGRASIIPAMSSIVAGSRKRAFFDQKSAFSLKTTKKSLNPELIYGTVNNVVKTAYYFYIFRNICAFF
jgi:uncharacterized membrane protein YadS